MRIVVNTCFGGMQFVRCEQKLPSCRRLQDELGAKIEVAEDDLGLPCCFFKTFSTTLFLMRNSSHHTTALGLEMGLKAAVRYTVLLG